MIITDEHLDGLAKTLIPILDRVSMPEPIHGDEPPDIGVFTSEDEQLQLAIQGRALMAISTPAPLRDGSYRIALSPNESWVVKSVLMSGLDSSTEIVLILTPRI